MKLRSKMTPLTIICHHMYQDWSDTRIQIFFSQPSTPNTMIIERILQKHIFGYKALFSQDTLVLIKLARRMTY